VDISWILYVVLGVALALLALTGVTLWLIFGRGPQRSRGYKRGQRLLREGKWHEALKIVHTYQVPGLSPLWQGRLRSLEGECYRAAGIAAVKGQDYEQGLEYHLRAADLLALNAVEVRATVIDFMLAEVRHLYATGDTAAAQALVGRTLILQSPCAEASFWQGLCHLRDGNAELAQQSLLAARGEQPAMLDPSLYLGGLLLKAGQAKESLRYLTEANRLDSNCPVVALALGTAIITAGGDVQIANRALQKALGPRGLQQYLNDPRRLWAEGFPENRSFVRKLAQHYPFPCPVWGTDVAQIIRTGNTALAQGLYRQGNFQEAAELYTRLLQETAPTAPVLRGLGLALTRLERYDQAFKHLRTAYELEQGRERWTAGYLALCGAKGRPSRPEDKERNVNWAVRVVCGFQAPGDAEWAQLVNQVFAEARNSNLGIPVEDQVYLCDHLASVHATDPLAAAAYHHLAVTHPEALKSPHAWLYCRAAHQHNISGNQAADLFARTFAEQAEARGFFRQHGWDFDELEYAFLERAAAQQPGQFPAVLGPDYPPRGEQSLLERTQRQEQAGQKEAALATAEVLVRLAPASGRAHDRIAQLYHRLGKSESAQAHLQQWRHLEPHNPLPPVRLAVLCQHLGRADEAQHSIRQALTLTDGGRRADLALLGARLALLASKDQLAADPSTAPHLPQVLELLDVCLREDPQNPQALWLLAAVRAVRNDRDGLVQLAPRMKRPDVADPRFQLLAAVCLLAAGEYDAVLEACALASKDAALAVECSFLVGWAQLFRRDNAAALQAFRVVAKAKESPSAPYAQAILGAIRFHEGGYDEAVYWWQNLDAGKRTAWQFAEPLQATVWLSALKALETGKYESAAEKLREAGRLGWRDKRLGPLLGFALVKAGQQLLYGKKG
jgi:tetratricopeptide (TPR) repeat protein